VFPVNEIPARAKCTGATWEKARGAKEKNLTFSRNDTGAVMYPASKVQPFWLRALM
jgi:hypothetical protein